MKILSAEQTRNLDQYTITYEPIEPIDLMERASQQVVRWLGDRYYRDRPFIILCGPGDNGGDGLAIARLLSQRRYKAEVWLLKSEKYSASNLLNQERLAGLLDITFLQKDSVLPEPTAETVFIDALFGSGLSRPLEGIATQVVNQMNTWDAEVVSIDVPSGLFMDKPMEQGPVMEARYTLTFQLPKLALLLPQYERFVGEFFVLNIGLSHEFIEKSDTRNFYLTEVMIKNIVKKRSKYAHKGTFGKSLIIAGSYGMLGAAVLACKGCLRSGAGLIKAYVPEAGFFVLQNDLPEVMVLTDPHPELITEIPPLEEYTAIGVGPGITEKPAVQQAFTDLLAKAKIPLVIDASALNILAQFPDLQKSIPHYSILTPHPGELERLIGKWKDDFQKLKRASDFAAQYKVFMIIKGAHTTVCTPDGKFYFNSTGNPGMATAGSGDVLTGIITGLLSQGYEPLQAALLGVYIHGYAGDSAARKYSKPAMIASDIAEAISVFYKDFGL
ncbi:MAG: NAD(P)H-hydrate dehydratase [Cytophagaceae bacterium]|jgi:NAD(P)H-hydrate epimerase|nr:NAD(P)H-hydrate dehydratase [Cytophagaceae bacterium]